MRLNFYQEKITERFYVYALIDPRNSRMFYVGKGKDYRAWSHTKLVQRGKLSGNPAKDKKIKAILALAMEPIVKIVARYELEQDAFDHEIELIASTRGLCNIRKGGEGWALSAEEAARRNEVRQEKIRERRSAAKAVKSKEYLTRWLARAETWPGCTIPRRDGGDDGDWFLATVHEILAYNPISVEALFAEYWGQRDVAT